MMKLIIAKLLHGALSAYQRVYVPFLYDERSLYKHEACPLFFYNLHQRDERLPYEHDE
jgi:hypothetical protein